MRQRGKMEFTFSYSELGGSKLKSGLSRWGAHSTSMRRWAGISGSHVKLGKFCTRNPSAPPVRWEADTKDSSDALGRSPGILSTEKQEGPVPKVSPDLHTQRHSGKKSSFKKSSSGGGAQWWVTACWVAFWVESLISAAADKAQSYEAE